VNIALDGNDFELNGYKCGQVIVLYYTPIIIGQ